MTRSLSAVNAATARSLSSSVEIDSLGAYQNHGLTMVPEGLQGIEKRATSQSIQWVSHASRPLRSGEWPRPH